jgi:hypothetical protein
MFIIGLISAAYPSADGALTALTTASLFPKLNKKPGVTEESLKNTVHGTFHLQFALLVVLSCHQ